MSPLVGTLLNGRYRLDAQIGHGGMSTVYRAFDQVLERTVAVKLMHRETATDAAHLERFRREARAVAQISHPHVVNVIDAGEDEGRPFIVLEYVEGETLKDRIRRCGRLPIDEAIAYAIEIARALGAAHARGIIHRDIKPQNVLIDEEGCAKVTDFGIARTLHDEGLTAEGRVLGTTDYVSPEQALGHAVNGQSDVYSLGIVLFEMLTGDVPFHGENQVAVAMKHVREDIPDIQVRRPEVSASLGAVLDHMTAKDLGVRYGDVATLCHELEECLAIEAARSGRAAGEATAILRSLPEDVRRRVPRRVTWHVSLLTLLAVGAIGAGVLLLLLKEGAERGTRGTGQTRAKPPTGTTEVILKRSAANDFDPLSEDKEEHSDDAFLSVDRDPSTVWATETYSDDKLTKAGVGIYVDADPGVGASSLTVHTPTPGWKATIFVAGGKEPPDQLGGWKQAAVGTVAKERHRFKLDGERNRFYLVWITELPPGESKVEIAEISLLQPKT